MYNAFDICYHIPDLLLEIAVYFYPTNCYFKGHKVTYGTKVSFKNCFGWLVKQMNQTLLCFLLYTNKYVCIRDYFIQKVRFFTFNFNIS